MRTTRVVREKPMHWAVTISRAGRIGSRMLVAARPGAQATTAHFAILCRGAIYARRSLGFMPRRWKH